MNNLSLIYQDQGRWKEAEELQVQMQVIETRKQVLGLEYPNTLTSMSSLAYTWKSLGNNQTAFALMNECFELRTKALGPERPDTTSSLHTLRSWKAADSRSWGFGRLWMISVDVISTLALAITGLQKVCCVVGTVLLVVAKYSIIRNDHHICRWVPKITKDRFKLDMAIGSVYMFGM